jgi:glycosyltransferase involved in cell wall biosynthesis
MKSLYCTESVIGQTGGGAAVRNELMALESISEVTAITGKELSLQNLHQPENPFLRDYLTLQEIKGRDFDLAHFYGGCFTETVRYLKEHGAKVSYMIAAHDRKLSIEEFHRLGLEYPFYHVSNDRLFEIYTEGHRLADVVLTQSSKSIPILREAGCAQTIEVVPGGITWPENVKPIPENFDCLYLGACGPDKGLIYLIQAWGMLDYPDSKLILAGSGTETLEPFIRQVTDKGIFVLLGRVPDISEVYNACSVYIQPSVTEGFGLEIPEAMSYGRAVIASEGAGASEIIEDGIDGFVVERRNPSQIAERIGSLKRDRADLVRMGEKAREKARYYTWYAMRQEYIKIWKKLYDGVYDFTI